MCGLIYCKNKAGTPVGERVLSIFEKQSGRGRIGFGFLEIGEDTVSLRRFVHEKDAVAAVRGSEASEILFHHRIPTSSINSGMCNHPIMSDTANFEYRYFLIHNGHITNYNDLKSEHEAIGIRYTSALNDQVTDSEALLYELALVIEGAKMKSEFAAAGDMAFILLQIDICNNPVALFFGRTPGTPLSKTFAKGIVTEIRSTGGAEEIEFNYLYKYNYKTDGVSRTVFNFNPSVEPKQDSHNIEVNPDDHKDEISEAVDRAMQLTKSLTSNQNPNFKILPAANPSARLSGSDADKKYVEAICKISGNKVVSEDDIKTIPANLVVKLSIICRNILAKMTEKLSHASKQGNTDEYNNISNIMQLQYKNLDIIATTAAKSIT